MTAAHFTNAYRPERQGAWHLALWISPSMHAWCVHDVRTNDCVALAAADGGGLPMGERLPRHPASVSFIAVPEISTLVPEGVLEEGGKALPAHEAGAHLELVHGPLPAGRLRDAPIDALSARCIYQHDEATEREVLQRFPSAQPMALHALLIKAVLSRGGERPTILVHRGQQRCDVMIASDGNVLLANSFPATDPTDLLYFSLFALDRTGLEPRNVRLYCGGTMLLKEERALLERYFVDVAPAIARNDRALAGLGVETPELFLALLEQRSCAS